jgi:hypothetical protein
MTADDPDDGSREKGILAPEELDITASPNVESIDQDRYLVSADEITTDTDQFGDSGGTDAELPAADEDEDNDESGESEESSSDDEDDTSHTTSASTTQTEEDAADDVASDTESDDEASGAAGGPPAQKKNEPQEAADPPAVELTQQRVSQFLAESLADAETSYGFDATVNIDGDVNRGRMSSDDIAETLEGLLRWYAKQTTDEVDPEAALGIILAGSTLEVEYPVQSAYAMLKQYGLQPDDSISELLTAVRKEGSFTVPPSKNQ